MTRLDPPDGRDTAGQARDNATFPPWLGQQALIGSSMTAGPTDNVSVAEPLRQHEPHRHLDPNVAESLRKARLSLEPPPR